LDEQFDSHVQHLKKSDSKIKDHLVDQYLVTVCSLTNSFSITLTVRCIGRFTDAELEETGKVPTA
jgi:hypothetical protein